MVLDLVVDGHRQLLDPGGDRLQDEVTDDPALCHCHEALASLVISRRVRLSLLLADAAACAVEWEEATVSNGPLSGRLTRAAGGPAMHPARQDGPDGRSSAPNVERCWVSPRASRPRRTANEEKS